MIAKIPQNNSFYLHYVPESNIPLSDMKELTVNLIHTTKSDTLKPDFEIVDNVIKLHVAGTEANEIGVYRFVISGKYNGEDIWRNPRGFERVENIERESIGSTGSCIKVENPVIIKDTINISFGNVDIDPAGYYNKQQINDMLTHYVKAVEGKQLSTEDFTALLRDKLEKLENYNDNVLNEAITGLNQRLNLLLGEGATDAIDTFNEIVSFLEGITDTENLGKMLSDLRKDIIMQFPNVPQWALQPEKPTYTAREVGATTEEYVKNYIASTLGALNEKLEGRLNGNI